MPLTLLAPEIILLLPPLIEKRDVSSLSKTCKRLRSIMLGQLYKSIQWQWNMGGKAVQRIVFEGPKMNNYQKGTATIWAPEGPTELTTSEIESTIQWAQRFQLITPGIFREALLRGDIDAYVCIVIAFLPALRSLSLSAEFILFNSEFLGSLFNQALQSSPTESRDISPFDALPQYTSLREVKLGHRTKESGGWSNRSHFKDMYSFFYLPSLEDLTIYLPTTANFNWPDDLSKRAPMKALTSLSLPSCEANEPALEQLLASRPPLKKLFHDYYCAEDVSHNRGYYVNLPTLSRAFSYVHSTIESLTFFFEHQAPDADDYPCYNHPHGLFNGTMAPFSQFSCLTYLEVPFVMLTGWEVIPRDVRPPAEMLPPSISHLCLTDNLANWVGCYWEVKHWLERLRDLLAAREESKGEIAGGLRIIEVKRESIIYEWESEQEEEFRWLGQRYRVEAVFSGTV